MLNIKSGFRKAGIYPHEPKAISKEKLTPCKVLKESTPWTSAETPETSEETQETSETPKEISEATYRNEFPTEDDSLPVLEVAQDMPSSSNTSVLRSASATTQSSIPETLTSQNSPKNLSDIFSTL